MSDEDCPTPSMQLLLRDLEKARTEENGEAVDAMIKLAKAGHYDDFQTTVSYPQIELLKDAQGAGLSRIVSAVQDGKYDADD